MKHKHYDCIIAWANGAEIEIKKSDGWEKVNWPSFNVEFEYRIAKPKPRTETRWLWANKHGLHTGSLYAYQVPEFPIKLEWSATEFEVEE